MTGTFEGTVAGTFASTGDSSGLISFGYMALITPGPDPLPYGPPDGLFFNGPGEVNIEWSDGSKMDRVGTWMFGANNGFANNFCPVRPTKVLAYWSGTPVVYACYLRDPTGG